ncbi:hypothetical protein ASF84_26710 [Pseudomonas sp. Leaf127]|uniref:BapA/Bap/LapF family large adhesin n=1 Tax=Pseudomonas sp. Leaf127 TaxID=1736267 RepID=UPI000703B816|nr:BapA/Bap/LapF family large adhesin [Pseudomonas sp. Leaf127]KQQ62622.1 hypothetical protein ASF84_26710 [Pseudomonas sp. Leaf127]
MDNIVVADKATSEISAREWGSFQLAKPGVVQMPVAPSQIASVNRNGQDLILTLKSGEKVTIGNFFATTAEGVQSDMVFVGEDGALWQAQYSADAFNGFTFAEVASIDTLIADAGLVDGATQTFAFAGLGLLGAGGAAAAAGGAGGGGGGGDDPVAPDAPGNLSLSTDGLTLNGTGTPGATVNVRNPDGTVVGSTVVGADGNFSVPLDTAQNNGEPLVVDQTDPNGNTSGGTPITAPDTRAPLAPANLQLSDDGLNLTGIGEAGATVTVRDANGNVLGTAVVGADGTFSVALGSAQLDGQTLNVDQADATGNVSPEATINAADTTAPAAPANLQVGANGLTLTGTGEAGATVTVRAANGALLGTAIVAANGTFSVVLGSAQLDGQTLSVVQTDTAGNVSPSASTTAPDGNDAPGAPTNLQLSTDGLTLTGRGEAGATVTVRGANGTLLGTAVVAANGTFSLTLGSAQLNGETLSVVQGNNDGTSPVASLTAADVTAPAAPTNLLVSADGLTLTGRGEAGATVTVRAADGSVLGSTVVAANGTFSLTLGTAQTDGQVLSVSQADAAGNLSPAASATAPDGVNAPSAPGDLQLNADGVTLTGTGQPGATVTVRNVDGTVLGSAVVAADGTFSLTLDSAQLNGETLSVVQTDAFGNSSAATSLTAADLTAPSAPANLLVSSDGLTLTGTGEAGATVTVRAADGSVLGSAVVAADGTFTVTLGAAQTDGQALSVNQTDAAGNLSPSTSTTAPDGVNAPSAPTGLQLSADGLTLTGSGEAGATLTVRTTNGAILGTAVVAADGTFSLTLNSAQLNGETLSAVQSNADGTSPSASLIAADVTAPSAPANLLVSSDGLTLTGTGEAGATLSVRDANGTLLGSTMVAADGSFSLTLASAQLDGQTLSVVQTDAAGNVSPVGSTIAPDGVDVPAAPGALQLSADGLTLTGTGEAGATVTVRGTDGAMLGTATVAADGTFSVTLGRAQLNGEILNVVQSDADGTSPSTSLTADDVTAPAAPANLQVSVSGLALDGTGEAGATVTVRAADGRVLGTAVVAADGTFSVTLGSAQTDGQVLSVSQADAAGNLSPVALATAPDGVNAPSGPGGLQLSADGLTLSGTGEAGATVSVRGPDGVLLGTAVVAADGTFSVPLDTAQLDGQTLSVVQADAGGTSPSTSLTVADVTAPAAPVNLLLSADGLALSGTGEAGATVTVRAADGSVLGTAVVAADGTFSVPLDTAQLNGQTLSVVQADAGGTSPPIPITAADISAPLAPASLQISANGLTLSGTGEAGATVTVRAADGSALGTAVVATNGTFSVTLDSAQLDGQVLSVSQTDGAGNLSPAALASAPDGIDVPLAPTGLQLSTDGLTLSGLGEAGATVTVRDANGNVLGSAMVAGDGRFSVTLDTAQLDGQTLSVVQADVDGTSPSASLTVPDVSAPQAPSGLLFNADGSQLSGQAEAGSTVLVRSADGTLLGSAVAAADGSFRVTLVPALADGEGVNVSARDPAGNVSPISSLTAPDLPGDTTPPAAATDLALNANGTVLTGRGEVGAQVAVTNAAGTLLGSGLVGVDGTFSITLDPAQDDGQALGVVLTDAAGNASPNATVTAPHLGRIDPPVDLAVSADGLFLTGRAFAGLRIFVRSASGLMLGSSTVEADGTFSVALTPGQVNGEQLDVTAADAAGNSAPNVTVMAPDMTAPAAVTALVVSPDGSSVAGKGQAGATVTVRDANGNTLASGVVAANGSFVLTLDPAVAGNSVLSLSQVDGSGLESPVSNVTVPDASGPVPPDSAILDPTGTAVSGIGVAGTTVEVRDANGNVLGSTVVAANGSFTVPLSAPQANGEVIEVVVIAVDGRESIPTLLTAPDTTAPVQPDSLVINADGLVISGRGEPGATVTVRDADGNLLGSGTVGATGSFSVPLASAQNQGQVLQVTLSDAQGNTSVPASLTAPDLQAPLQPASLALDATGTVLSGTGRAGSTITVTDQDNNVLGTAVVGANGLFSVTLASVQNNGQVLEVTAVSATGESATPVDFAVPDTLAPQPVTDLSLNANRTQLSGEGEAGARVTVRNASGTVLGTALVAADGSFNVALSPAPDASEVLQVVQADAAGNLSDPVNTVPMDTIAPDPLSNLAISANGSVVSGNGEIGARVLVFDPAGMQIGNGLVGLNGRFEITLTTAQDNGQALTLTQTDAANNTSPIANLDAPDIQPPSAPANLLLAGNGLTLTGSGEAGATISVRDATGTEIGTATVAANGTFSLTLTSAQLNGQNLSVLQTDSGNNASSATALIAADSTAPLAATNLVISANGATLTGTGEAGTTVKVTGVGGVALGTAVVAANGSFTVTLVPAQIDGQQLSVTLTDGGPNVSLAQTVAAPSLGVLPQPDNLAIDADGLTLTGTAQAGTTVQVYAADGSSLGSSMVLPDGTFSVVLGSTQLNGQILELVIRDDSGRSSLPLQYNAPDSTPPAAVANLAISPDGLTVSGTGEAGSIVTVTRNGTPLGTVTVGSDGVFTLSLDSAALTGDSLSVVARDAVGNAAPAVLLAGPDANSVASPTGLLLSADGLTLTGLAAVGSVVRVSGSGGALLGTSTVVGADGTFSVSLAQAQTNGQTLYATASAGGQNSVPALLLAADTTAPDAPTNLMINADGSFLTGRAEAGASLTVRGPDGSVLGTATASSTGTFIVTLSPAPLNAQLLSVTQTDGGNNTSPSATVNAPDLQAPAAPTELAINAAGTVVSGKGEAGATVQVRDAGGALLASGVVDGSGHFQVSLAQPQLTGAALQVQLTDAANQSSPASSLATLDRTPPAVVSDLNLSADATTLAGRGEAGATVQVRDANGTVLGSATVAVNGTFSVTLAPAPTNGQTLEIVQVDVAGNTSSEVNLNAPDISPPAALANVVINTDGLTVTGNGEPGATVFVRNIGGTVLGSALVGANGGFSVTLSGAQLNAQLLTVNQEDPPGNEGPSVNVTAPDITPPATPDQLLLNATGLQVTGRGEAGSTITVSDANGRLLGTGTVGANGLFQLTLSEAQLNAQTLSVNARDTAGNTSGSASLLAADLTPPAAVTALAVAANGATLTGLGEAGAEVTVTNASGTVLGTAFVAANGTFSVTLSPAASTGSVLTVIQSDEAGNDSPGASVTAPGNLAPDTPSNLSLSADGLSLSGTGTAGSTVVVLSLNGQVLGTTLVAANGSFSVDLLNAQLNGETLSVSATNSGGYSSLPTQLLAADVKAPDALTDYRLSTDGLTVTGRGEAGATVTISAANGADLGTAVVAANGTFSATLSQPQLNGQVLNLTQTDVAQNESVAVSLIAADRIAPLIATGLALDSTGTRLSGLGEAGVTVTVTNSAGTVLGTGIVRVDGTFQVTLDTPQLNGQPLAISLADAAGNVSPVAGLVAADRTAPMTLTDLVFAGDGVTITGRGEAGATVRVGNSLDSVVISPTGAFTLVLGTALLNGQTISLTQVDGSGNVSPAASLLAPDSTAPLALQNVLADPTGTRVTGSGEAGATVIVRNAGGVELGRAMVMADGSFSVALSPAQINAQALNVQQIDLAGNLSPTSTVPAPDLTPPALATGAINAAGSQISGIAEAGATVRVSRADGTLVGTVTANPDGTFALLLNPPLVNKEALHVVVIDTAQNLSPVLSLTAPDLTPPAAVANLQVNAQGNQLTGTGEAGATVTVLSGNISLGTVMVASDGTFTVALNTPQLNGQVLTVQQTDAAGNPSPSVTTPAPDTTAPNAPGAFALINAGLTLNGTGEAGASVTVRNADQTVLGVGTVASNGTFSIDLSAPQLDGERLSIRQTDTAGNASANATFTAPDITAPDAVANLALSLNGLVLTGTGEAGATVQVSVAGTALGAPVLVGSEGTFSVNLGTPQLNGEVLSVVQTDISGSNQPSPAVTLNAPDITAPDLAIVGLPTASTLSVNAEIGSTVTVRAADGSLLGTAVITLPGTTVIALNTPQITGAPLTVVASDLLGNATTLIVDSLDTTPPPLLSNVALNSTYTELSGLGEAGATVTVTRGGTAIGTAVVAADGTFTVTFDTPVVALQTLIVTQADTAATPNVSLPVTLTVPLFAPPAAPANVVLSADGNTVTGQGTAGLTVNVNAADGTVLGTTTVLPDNSFSVTLNQTQTNGEQIKVTTSALIGGDSSPVFVTAPDTTAPDPLANVALNPAGTVVTGNGEAGATVIISNAAGVELGRATVAANGGFSVTLSSAQTNGQVLDAVQRDAANNISTEAKVFAADTTAPLLASNLAVTTGGTVVTGNGEAGTTISVRNAVGTEIGTGLVSAAGTFSVTLTGPALLNGERVQVTLSDAALNVSPIASVNAPDTTPPAAPGNLAIVGSGLQLTGTGEAGATVYVTSPLGVALGNALVASDGSFTVQLASAQLNGQVLSVRQADAAGNASPVVTTIAGDTVAPLLATNLVVAAGGASLSGSGEAGTTVEVRSAGNGLLGSGTVGSNGLFTVVLSPVQTDGEVLSVRLTDAAQNVSLPASVTAPDTTAPAAPATAVINATGSLISGTGIAGDRIAVDTAGGTRLGTALVAANGTWSLILSPAQIDSQVLSVTQLDAANNASPAVTVTAPDLTPPPAATALLLSVDGLTLTGSAEAGATVTVKNAVGATLGTTTAQANGSFSVGLSGAQINGETLTVGVADARGNPGPNVTLVAVDVDAGRPVVASDNLTTATVNLAAVSTTRTYTDSFPTLVGLGFSHTFNFTVDSGTTADPVLTLTSGGVLDLGTRATFTLQVQDSNGAWVTLGTAGNGSLINLDVLSSTGVRVDISTLLAGTYRLTVASNSLTAVTNINSTLVLDINSLSQFNGAAGAAVTGNVISDVGTDGTRDITGPDNGAVVRMQTGTSNGSPVYTSAGTGLVVQGLYGTLTIDAQGNYSYRASGSASSVGKVDVFTYQLLHANGLSDTATLYVRIDSPQAIETWSNTNLATPALLLDASNDVASTDITLANRVVTNTSTLGTVSAGLLSLSASGTEDFTLSGAGTVNDLTLTLTSSGLLSLLSAVNVTLLKQSATNANQYDVVKTWSGTNALINLGGGVYGASIDDQPPGNYRVSLSYTGVSVGLSITVGLINSTTLPNQFVVNSSTPVAGNLLTDTAGGGADVLGSALTVLSVLAAANTYVQPGYNGTSIIGTYGTLLVQANGDYTYTLKPGLTGAVIGQEEVFTYRLTHPNGSTDTATLTIDLDQASTASSRMALASADNDDASNSLAASTGTAGNDTLDGSQGGAVSLHGGAGNDKLIISDLDFVAVDGGTGTDTLLWAGGDASINLGNLHDRLSNIEVIDLNTTSSVNLTLNLADLVAVTEADNSTLLIKGSTQDSVHLGGTWAVDGTQLADGLHYTQYTPQEDPTHHLWVQNGIQVV